MAKRTVTIVLILFLLCLVSCTEKKNENFFGKLEYPEELFVMSWRSDYPYFPWRYQDKDTIKTIIDMVNACEFVEVDKKWDDLTWLGFDFPINDKHYSIRSDDEGNYYFSIHSAQVAASNAETGDESVEIPPIYHAKGFDMDILMKIFEALETTN